MPENNIYFHRRDRQIQVPSGGLDYLSLSPGDTIYITGSGKNDGAYTVASSNDSQIFVKESLNDELKTDAVITKPSIQKPPEAKKLPTPTPEKPTRPLPAGPALPAEPTGEFVTAPPALIFPPPPPAPAQRPELPKEEPEEKPETKKPTPKKPGVSPELIITRIEYPKWWKELLVSPINIVGPASQTIASPGPNNLLYVSAIVLTVDGETTIRFTFGQFGISGVMNFGAYAQPMGMVIALGGSPIPCGDGGFSIYSSGDGISVGGFASYYLEKK